MNWMAWTLPTALFFLGIAVLLLVMVLVELKRPGTDRRGFFPLVTSRGDRLFISLLGAAYVHLLWLGLTSLPLVLASLIAVAVGIVVMRWG